MQNNVCVHFKPCLLLLCVIVRHQHVSQNICFFYYYWLIYSSYSKLNWTNVKLLLSENFHSDITVLTDANCNRVSSCTLILTHRTQRLWSVCKSLTRSMLLWFECRNKTSVKGEVEPQNLRGRVQEMSGYAWFQTGRVLQSPGCRL